uniref:Tim44-like domain-containing protein n=1 Tax=Plectus sambesii TaxID=2011161 RepID=A0A914WQ82_9BILA
MLRTVLNRECIRLRPCCSWQQRASTQTPVRHFADIKLHSSDPPPERRRRAAPSVYTANQSFRGRFPMFVPLSSPVTKAEPEEQFTSFRDKTQRRMQTKFGLSKETTLAEDEKGFRLADWPLITSYIPPGMSPWKMAANWFKQRQRLQKVKLHDPLFYKPEMLKSAAKLVQMVATKLSKREYNSLTDIVHESLLAELEPRVEALTKRQRRALAYGEGDYVMGTPLLLSTDVRKEDSQVFVDFLVFDVAMFEVAQMGFEAAGESAPRGALIDKKEGIIGEIYQRLPPVHYI